MRIKEKKELFTKTIQELKKVLSETRQELFLLKQDLAQSKLKDTSTISRKRKDIARILTIIKEKENLENVKNI